MTRFLQGEYAGIHKSELAYDGVILSETVYEESFASAWHTHENPYFAFIMSGGCVEERRSGATECVPAKMLFYNGDEPHKNARYQPGTKIFNIEFSNAWLAGMGVKAAATNGITVNGPGMKLLMLKIFSGYRLHGAHTTLGIESMAIQLLSALDDRATGTTSRPAWATRLHEMFQDGWQENYTLREVAGLLGIHPVTISRYFPKYFNCNLEEYIRKIRVTRALTLIRKGEANLTGIAHTCGFADQSHFIRVFKKETGLLPNQYRAL